MVVANLIGSKSTKETHRFFRKLELYLKENNFKLYLKENNFDIATLNETFLTKKIDFKIQGYDTKKNDGSTGARGGVAFLVKHGLVINT